MPEPLAHKRIVLGVTGGIAAYKAVDLASKLVQLGADVRVVMTDGAKQFVQPLSFSAITHNPVYSSVFEGWQGDRSGHVTLAAEADLVIVAPATANMIARMFAGLTDDMLGAVLLATQAPILIAPAMEHHMWHHPATIANLATLTERGIEIVPPESGRLASGASGDGRLAAIETLVNRVRRTLGRSGPLSGRRVVITAGGTHEAIDPVRFVGNGSSGAMGNALALAAVDAGAHVTLIAGPTMAATPIGVDVIRVQSALDMLAAVREAVREADVLIMAAAVADFRPANVSARKLKKNPDEDTQLLELVKNPDIIASVQQPGLVKVGFAAETDDLITNAVAKLNSKGLDLIIANDAVATIGSSTSQATLIQRDLQPETLPEMSKAEVAQRIVARVAGLVNNP
ncbi:MAG: bifunctional phosphopantothenoylcysteine decarboxylase/phosphopantothenate--cysteine ligase CoaBC [Thermomicrobiales bacterium]|nr:bifunctional phosphopantothenoylcysteine decarboxylase/phosphopantothenate--cysteine ligase CoaBC [Thermomicrobiales bacterium]MCO5225533.1 bifunctional phosphopantothenoylcysteine decarboxylase/phosphopantothenate--cysteine ligase CoaBC [Thermomicrobiales bacterium]MCO5228183.1 bifunctional phosphopantothenoylcysteine decarboxylase/phosphopantothenate--cysteine ligase CoaBC [Thermomicrobiales bacterium]